MKKVLLVAAALLSLAWGTTVMACTSDADCRPNGVGTDVCVCTVNSGAPNPSPVQCGQNDVIPGVLEISGCADGNTQSVAGCIEVAETVAIGGNPASPIVAPVVGTHRDCDAAANAACLACGCGVCQPSAED